jgi:hypothetical protein
MITSKIIYFSLLSVSWISAVSAVLDVQQRGIIDLFRQRLQDGDHLADAYDTTDPAVLDAYYWERIRYSNLSILNNLKWDMGPISCPSILSTINM